MECVIKKDYMSILVEGESLGWRRRPNRYVTPLNWRKSSGEFIKASRFSDDNLHSVEVPTPRYSSHWKIILKTDLHDLSAHPWKGSYSFLWSDCSLRLRWGIQSWKRENRGRTSWTTQQVKTIRVWKCLWRKKMSCLLVLRVVWEQRVDTYEDVALAFI